MISKDGYNRGRDWFVERAAAGTFRKGIWWKADVEWREGLLEPGRKSALSCSFLISSSERWVNCRVGVDVNHGIAQDGRVAVLTVRRLWI